MDRLSNESVEQLKLNILIQDLRWRLAECRENIKYLTNPINERRRARATIKTIEENEGMIKEYEIKLALMNENEYSNYQFE